jgi:hypothetical protein
VGDSGARRVMTIMRRLRSLIFVAALAVSLVVVTNAPAYAAGENCTAWWHGGNICVEVWDGRVWAEGNRQVGTGYFYDITGYVVQCRPDITYCGTIIAKHDTTTYVFTTSDKDAPYGHVFKACASWTDSFGYHVVNYCSGWRSWP